MKKNKRLTTSHKVTKKNNRNKIILMILIPIMILVLAGVTYGAKLYAEAKKTKMYNMSEFEKVKQ